MKQQELTDKLITVLNDIAIVFLIILICRLFLKVISFYTARVIKKAEEKDNKHSKDVITAMTITRSVCRYVISFIGFMLVLKQFGFASTLNNLILTAGIGGIAITFGAQNLIKDVIGGFLLVFEKQYSVGDFVKINEYEGKVTSIAMRLTYLQSIDGRRIIIPNGSISTVVNYSTASYGTAIVTVPTPYESDTKEIISLLQDTLDKYYQNNTDRLIESPIVRGPDEFSPSSLDIKIVCKCQALQQWEIGREVRLLIKETFDQNKISIPYQQIVITQKEEE